MTGERGDENTSVESAIHYCDRWIVFVRQDVGGGILLQENLPQNATVWTNVYWVLKSRKRCCFL